jgi:hypothetical protein
MHFKKYFLILGSFAVMVFGITFLAGAAPISPLSYDMINGGTGSYNYWDESYSGAGSKTTNYAYLSGGKGDLTNGIIPAQNWNIVEAPTGPGPYVGWLSYDPVIKFHFGNTVAINSITFYVDDSNGNGGVRVPSGFTINGTLYNVSDPSGSAPTSYIFSNLGLSLQDLTVTIHRRSGSWVFASEITFDGTSSVVPIPGALWLFAPGLAGLAGLRKKYFG